MTEIVCSTRVAIDTLQGIVDACDFGRQARLLAERLPMSDMAQQTRQNSLIFSYFVASSSCSTYTSGRVFQDDRELRWERQGNTMHVVYVGPAEYEVALQAYGLKKSPVLDTLTKRAEPTYYYLFGERLRPEDVAKLGRVAQAGDFAVVRIPRMLRYPVEANGERYARLVVCEYEDATGQVALFRFQNVETVKE